MIFGIEDIRREYDRLDIITGVDTRRISLRISGRMTRKLGQFSVSGGLFKQNLEIVISKRCLNDEDLFYEVIRHEYAHAVVHLRRPLERHVHDKVWKDVCREIGCRPRATIKLGDSYTQKQRPYKYEVVCKRCGASSKYKTMSKIVKIALKPSILSTLSCRRCGGHQFDVFKLS